MRRLKEILAGVKKIHVDWRLIAPKKKLNSKLFFQAQTKKIRFFMMVCAAGVVWDNQSGCCAYMSAPHSRSDELDLIRYPVGYRLFRTREVMLANANRLIALGRVEEAEALCEDILKDWHNHPGCLMVHSHVHLARGDHAKARQAIRDSIDNDPDNMASRNLLARLLVHQAADFYSNGDVEAAYEGYRQIILMDMYEFRVTTDVLTEVYFNMGKLLQGLGMTEEAITHYEAVTLLDSHNFKAFAAMVELMLNRQEGTDEQVILAVKNALKAKGVDDAPGIWSMLLKVQLERCDWSTRYQDADRLMAQLKLSAARGTCDISPLLPLQLLLPASFAVDCATASSVRIQAHLQAPSAHRAAWIGSNLTEHAADSSTPGDLQVIQESSVRRVLTVGFISGIGFGNDTSAGPLLFGPRGWLEPRQPMRKSWVAACISVVLFPEFSSSQLKQLGCDEVHTVAQDSDLSSAAALVKSAAVDVVVHVGGSDDEMGVSTMAMKLAPLQMVWLGREMSSGSGFIDVMVTDKIMSPPDLVDLYSEHLIYLPVSGLTSGPYGTSMPLVSDILHVTARRKVRGLQPEFLTFGVLGPASRIDPDLWAVWMEVLRYTPPSQLWLTRGGSQHVLKNLQYQAEQSGILPRRIVVSDTDVPAAEAAVLADLILDSRTLNANAGDVLAAVLIGVPVVSLPGDSPSRRTSASLLVAHGLAGLFTTRDLADYEETATRLGKSLLQAAKRGCNPAAAQCKGHAATAVKTGGGSTKRQRNGTMGVLDRAWALAWEVAGMQENVQHRDEQKYHILVTEGLL